MISKFPLRNIKRVDEKILKILEGVGQQARRDPLTGIVPPTFIHGDFHNTFKLLGICGIDRRVTPVFFKIHKDKKNSTEHNEFILEAVAQGYLQLIDILISDNAYYHWGGEAATLEDYLWEKHNILIVYLPPPYS